MAITLVGLNSTFAQTWIQASELTNLLCAPIQTFKHENYAIWVPYQSFDDVAPGLLHYGTNSLRVVITDEGDINYFSMIVSTNACGQ
jgi:hypothetical protein